MYIRLPGAAIWPPFRMRPRHRPGHPDRSIAAVTSTSNECERARMGAKGLSAAVAAVAALALSFKVLLGGLSKKAYDGLNGVISFSSKLIAGGCTG